MNVRRELKSRQRQKDEGSVDEEEEEAPSSRTKGKSSKSEAKSSEQSTAEQEFLDQFLELPREDQIEFFRLLGEALLEHSESSTSRKTTQKPKKPTKDEGKLRNAYCQCLMHITLVQYLDWKRRKS